MKFLEGKIRRRNKLKKDKVFLDIQKKIVDLLNQEIISLDDSKQLHNLNIIINRQKLGLLKKSGCGSSTGEQ